MLLIQNPTSARVKLKHHSPCPFGFALDGWRRRACLWRCVGMLFFSSCLHLFPHCCLLHLTACAICPQHVQDVMSDRAEHLKPVLFMCWHAQHLGMFN